jgi:hypothetical protein
MLMVMMVVGISRRRILLDAGHHQVIMVHHAHLRLRPRHLLRCRPPRPHHPAVFDKRCRRSSLLYCHQVATGCQVRVVVIDGVVVPLGGSPIHVALVEVYHLLL